MSALGTVRSNWRVVLLGILLVLSAIALFAPSGLTGSAGASPGTPANATSGTPANATSGGPTNLQYGIQLDGGARIQAPIVGLTASDVPVTGNQSGVERQVARRLDLDQTDVTVRMHASESNTGPTVEVFANVSRQRFASALQAAGYDVPVEDVADGVTAATREEMADTISQKLNAAGLSGGSVTIANTPAGDHYFIVIEAPNRNVEELRSLLSQRGVVRVVAYYPENGTYRNATVLEQGDFASIDPATVSDDLGPHVPVTLKESVAERFSNQMVEYGYGNGADCSGFDGYGSISPPKRCLLTVRDGEVVYSAGVTPGLGSEYRSGEFVKRPQFVMQTLSREEARQLSIDLRAGALPAPLDFQHDQEYYLQPALAQRFKTNSLLTGIIAVLAVSLVVYGRYRNPKVAAPMVLTALSEVALLLGFSAAIQYPLDLSVIAGFIAVIGTGVDDLVIIADEVMSEGEVNSSRVFRNRFRKALWVIGGAAATTIIAMSPLAVLSLGDLKGFAIITILGVLIGVLITRPAYGDILRILLTDR